MPTPYIWVNGIAATNQQVFQPSKFQLRQAVCGKAVCQQKRRAEYHRHKITADPEYREVCRDSPRKWRARNPGYWKSYREKHPDAADRNRERQKFRDRRRKLRHLANNTSALDLKHSAAEVWLVGSGTADLANNNSAAAQVWVIEALPRRPAAAPPACKQHPAGESPAPAA